MTGLDCGDNSCEFAPRRGGMRTNGGCSCLDGLSVEQRRKVRAVIHAAGVEIERLRDADEASRRTARTFQDERDSLRQQLENERRGFGDALKLERESADHRAAGLRQQLETARREKAETTTDMITADRRVCILEDRLTETTSALTAAQQQLAAIRTALQSPDDETLVDAALRVRALAEQRLEDLAAERRNRAVSEMEAAETLATAQRRISELETRAATPTLSSASPPQVERSLTDRQRIEELERECNMLAATAKRLAEIEADLGDARQQLAASEHVVLRLRQQDERQAARIASLDGELEARTSELAFLDRSLDAVQKQLKSTQAISAKCSCTHEQGDSDCAKHPTCPNCAERLDGTEVANALVAAQQRIAELEAASVKDSKFIARMQEQGLERSQAHRECDDRLPSALAALRAITPVYRAAGPHVDRIVSQDADFKMLEYATNTARAALTTELLAVIEAVGK